MPEKCLSEGRGVLHPPLPSDTHQLLQVGAGATHPYLQQKINAAGWSFLRQLPLSLAMAFIAFAFRWLAEKTPSNGGMACPSLLPFCLFTFSPFFELTFS